MYRLIHHLVNNEQTLNIWSEVYSILPQKGGLKSAKQLLLSTSSKTKCDIQ